MLGTLILQGLTLKPLLRAQSRDNDPVDEVSEARARALRAGLAEFEHDTSPAANAVREEFTAHLGSADGDPAEGDDNPLAHNDIHRRALHAARQTILTMRANDEIGDDAFHRLEEELDWIEMAGGGRDPVASRVDG